MSVTEIFQIAGAVVVSLGGGAALVFSLSSWLGRIWAEKILAADKQKYEREMEEIRARFDLSLKEYEIKTSAIQDDRKRIILLLTPALIKARHSVWEYGFLITAFGPDEDLRESQLEAKRAREELYELISESRLFLAKDLYDELNGFHKILSEVWAITSAESRVWKQRKSDPEQTVHSKNVIEEQRERVSKLDEKLEVTLARFRAILGTDR